MPNRIVPDSWLLDERFERAESAAFGAELFFRRLFSVADDYGRYLADLRALKSACFPLRTRIRDTDIARWLSALSAVGVLSIHESQRGRYVQIAEDAAYSRDAVKGPRFGDVAAPNAVQGELPILYGTKQRLSAVEKAGENLRVIESKTEAKANDSGIRALSRSGKSAQAVEGKFAASVSSVPGDAVWEQVCAFLNPEGGLMSEELWRNGAMWRAKLKAHRAELREAVLDGLNVAREERIANRGAWLTDRLARMLKAVG